MNFGSLSPALRQAVNVISYAMRVLLFYALIYFTASCNPGTQADQSHNFKNLTTDSLLLQDLFAKTKALNLPPIDKGVDSFEIRIWHGISIATPKWLVVLRYQDSVWNLMTKSYWIRYLATDGVSGKVVLDSCFTKTLRVPFNISNLVDSIRQFRIETFPSQLEIPGFVDKVSDGLSYQIELATPKFYKAIGYRNPFRYHDVNNQKVARLITMMNDIGVFSMP